MENWEQKYKGAIERAKAKLEEAKVFDYDDEQTAHVIRLTTFDIFPELAELAENEDEKIRKEIVEFICWATDRGSITTEQREKSNSWLAWLEKQDEHNKFIKSIQVGDQVTRNKDGLLVNLSQLKRVAKPADKTEEQSEQKPVVIPKFKVGDIITPKGKKEYYTISDIVDGWYEFKEKHVNGGIPIYYQFGWELVEQKPEWSEEDEIMCNLAINFIALSSSIGKGRKNTIAWLNSLKNRCLPQPKQEWSEEDEDNFKHLMDEIVCLGNNRNSSKRLYYDRLIKFLEELKNRAQPRKEWCDKDERMLDRLIAYFEKRIAFTDDDNPRYADWLKSLRPQKKQEWTKEDIDMIDWLIRCCEEEHKELCNDRYGHQEIVSDLKRDCRKKMDWLEKLQKIMKD